MTNLATGKQFTRRDFGKGLAAIFASGVAPALLGQTARGLMHRNLGGRIATSASVEKAENKIVVAIPAGATSGFGVTFECDRPASAQVVDWGDGTTTSVSGTSASHTYAASGTYNITWPDALLNVTARGTPYITSVNWKIHPTYMRDFAFNNCTSLASVGDLSSCTRVNNNVFEGCEALESVGDLSSCTIVGNYAFKSCSQLSEINLLSCTSIAYQAFRGCTSLASVGDLSSCTSIANYAFSNCTSLMKLTFSRKTISEVKAITNFPWAFEKNNARINCSDGYTVYDGRNWVDHYN